MQNLISTYFEHDLVSLPEIKATQTEQGRFYLGSGGQKYASVTTVLGRRKEKRKSLAEWRQRVGNENANKISGRASRRGTSVHKLVERFVMNEQIDPRKEMPLNIEMFRTLEPIIAENLKLVRAVEIGLISDTLRLAGRTDVIGTWKDSNAVIDIKTSTRVKEQSQILDYFLQCTAYAIMFEEATGIHTPDIVVAIAVEDDQPQIFERKVYEYEPILMDFLKEYNK